MQQTPWIYGIARTRWRLQDLGQVITWMHELSLARVSRLLWQLGFRRKQGLYFVRSPDPNFRYKWQAVLQAYAQALERPGEVIILFLDELTYYRQPEKTKVYSAQGKPQPKAFQTPQYNTQTRLVAVLNGVTGQVNYLQRKIIGKEALVAFYAQVRAAYPTAARIYVVQDNWPTHKTQEVLAALQEHGLTPLFLPTYASWLNPIEKLWRWLKQDILHQHIWSHDLERLREKVLDFLNGFQGSSETLLRYTGLLSV